MDPQTPPPTGNGDDRCSCACPCCSSPPSASPWSRSTKRKLDLIVATRRDLPADSDVARVEVETEVAALREALAGHQQSIQDLCAELEEERNAASTAASETMSMILRIQREKAEAQMEARQFKRFAEEKMAHDQRELDTLEDLLFRREQALQSISCELQAYKHRLLSYGIDPSFEKPQTPDASTSDRQFDLPTYDYPPLRCSTAHADLDPDNDDDCAGDREKYALRETPRAVEDLQTLEHRIRQLETAATPSSLVMEKGMVGQSTRHHRRSSADSYGLGSSSSSVPQESKKEDEFPVTFDRASDNGGGDDDESDRVYTIDAVHGVAAMVAEDCTSSPRKPGDRKEAGGAEVEEEDIKKLYMRLEALEADRESMRQAIITMRTEKAQLVLLREIAQQLCKEVKPEERAMKKPSTITSFSIISTIKWIVSFLFWRRKAHRCKYTLGLSSNNAGLLLLLDKSQYLGQWRCLARSRG